MKGFMILAIIGSEKDTLVLYLSRNLTSSPKGNDRSPENKHFLIVLK